MPVFNGKLRDLLAMVEKLGPNLATLLPFLQKYYPQIASEIALVTRFLAIEEPVTTDIGIQARVAIGLEMAKVFATATETTVDDQVLVTVEKLLSNTALQHLLASVLQKLLGDHTLKVEHEMFGAYKLDFEAASIPWDKIMALLPLLLEIFKLFGFGK